MEKEFEDILENAISHGICVSNLAYAIGKEMELEEEICYELAMAGLLHDIGKIRLAAFLYDHDENRTHVEKMAYTRMHSQLSYDIVKEKKFSEFVQESVLYHHENYDGSGYPGNLKGEEIPIGARILRVCDVFGALISDRYYRKAFPPETALELMIDEVTNFDMKIFLAFQRVINTYEIEELMGI